MHEALSGRAEPFRVFLGQDFQFLLMKAQRQINSRPFKESALTCIVIKDGLPTSNQSMAV